MVACVIIFLLAVWLLKFLVKQEWKEEQDRRKEHERKIKNKYP